MGTDIINFVNMYRFCRYNYDLISKYNAGLNL